MGLGVMLLSLTLAPCYGQANEIAQLALNIEKLAQLKNILDNMRKGYDIVSKGYGAVKDISQGNFNIHKVFLDGLMEVSPMVRKYRKVGQIVNYQLILVNEYKAAGRRFGSQGTFNQSELEYIGRVYSNLLNESLKNLDELLTVTTAGKLRMSDDERIQAIDRIFASMEEKVVFLRSFNNETSVLSLSRAREQNDIERMEKINGIKRD